MKHTITILVANRAGALSKISGLFSRRGFNIESLAVGAAEDPRQSRMTVVVDCDETTIEQVEKQLNKLIDTVKVKVLPEGGYIARELTLLKVRCNAKQRPDIVKIAELMNARLIDMSPNSLTLEFTDSPERTDTLITLLKPFGICELVSTGISAIEKSAKPNTNRQATRQKES